MTFKITKEIKEKYKNVPKDYLESLEGINEEKANEILKLFTDPILEDNFKNYDKKNEIDDLFYNYSLEETIKILEEEKRIKITISDKKNTSESGNKGYISIYSNNNQLVGEIRTALYDLGNGKYVDSHLGVEVNPEFQGQSFGTLLYKLYKKLTEEQADYFFPSEEFATTNSRILLLQKIGYTLESKYIGGEFIDISEKEKEQIIKEAKENYYDTQKIIYRFIYNG